MNRFAIGDYVICKISGVSGKVIEKYFPTACEQQTMIETDDGRLYHAPTREFVKLSGKKCGERYEPICKLKHICKKQNSYPIEGNVDRCVSCGAEIPEGSMMCPICERRYD